MVNYLAVLVSAVVSFFIGFIWYGPLFGKLWIKLNGFDKKKMEEEMKHRNMKALFVVAFIQGLVMAYVLERFVTGSVINGAITAAWIWLGFIATVLLNKVLWMNKPVKLYIIDIAHHFVVLIVMAAILGYWV